MSVTLHENKDSSAFSQLEKTPDQIELNTISSIGRFQPKPFIPHPKKKSEEKVVETEFSYNIDGLKFLQAKKNKLLKNNQLIESDISFIQSMIERQQVYMNDVRVNHKKQVELIKQHIENRKAQILKIDTSQEPPTINQIAAIVRQIQVEGMAAKRRAENCLYEQDINIVLSGERLRAFHEVLGPKIQDSIMHDNPKLRKAYERLENDVYRTAEMQTLLRSIRVYSTNLDKKLIEMNSILENLQFEKVDIQTGIVNKKEEFQVELAKRSEELGKMKWKIEYLKALKKKMQEPHFSVRKIQDL